VFNGSRLRIDSVHHRHVGVTKSLGPTEPLNLAKNELGLVALVVGLVKDDLAPPLVLSPQLLLFALLVGRDHRARNVENGLGGAIVLLEQGGLELGEVTLAIE